jgi:hypothetical protein
MLVSLIIVAPAEISLSNLSWSLLSLVKRYAASGFGMDLIRAKLSWILST